jgi:hypothetical protein
MKVYSLYDKDKTFLGAFPSREFCVTYAKVLHPNADGWDYDIVEEYLSKTPYNMYVPPVTMPLTPPNSIPCVSPVISKPPTTYPDTYPHIYCDGTK